MIAKVLSWLAHALAVLALWTLAGFLVALALGAMISRADRDAEAIEAQRQRAAEADEIALSMQFGGASDFQHDNGGAR